MDLPNKEALLEKYWQGISSDSEERQLKKLCKDRPELFTTEEQLLLNSLSELSTLALPIDFGKKIIADAQRDLSPRVNHADDQSEPEGRLLKLPKTFLRIAAALLFLVTIGWGIQQQSNSNALATRFPDTETEVAYQEAQQALLLIASKMSKVKSLTTALGKFESTHDKIKSVNPH